MSREKQVFEDALERMHALPEMSNVLFSDTPKMNEANQYLAKHSKLWTDLKRGRLFLQSLNWSHFTA